MRVHRLVLVAVSVLLAACAEKSQPPATVSAPPAVSPPPAPPARSPAPSPPAQVSPPAPRPATPAPSRPAPPPQSPPPAVTTPVLFIGVARANFREGPDVRARILAVLSKGTKLTVLEKGQQWYRVRLDDGKEGWVAESVTSATPD